VTVKPWGSKAAILRKTWVGRFINTIYSIVADIQNRGKPCKSPTRVSLPDPSGLITNISYLANIRWH
jgi:hypothetical protein